MKLRTWWLFVFCALLVCAPFADAYSPWGGGGAVAPSGGGAQQGIPANGTFTPATFGTGNAWQANFGQANHAVIVPTGVSGHFATGWWYTSSSACTTGATEPAWPTAANATVVDNTCTWTATGTTAVLPSTWTTAVDFDWTQGSSTSFTTDGAFSFGGVSWTKWNSANETVHTSAGGGTGLNFQPNSGTNFSNTTRNMPIVALSLQSAVPGIQWGTPLRILVWEATSNATSSGNEFFQFGIDGGDTHRPMIAALYYNTGGSSGLASVANGDTSSHTGNLFVNNGYNSNPSDYSAARILQLEFPQGFVGFQWNGYLAAVPAVGIWPAQGSFAPMFVQVSGVFTGGWNNTVPNMWWMPTSEESPTTLTNMEFYFGTQATVSGFSATINRIRIDYKPN